MKCISAKQEDIDINIVLKVVYCSPPLFNDKIKGHFPMISSFRFYIYNDSLHFMLNYNDLFTLSVSFYCNKIWNYIVFL